MLVVEVWLVTRILPGTTTRTPHLLEMNMSAVSPQRNALVTDIVAVLKTTGVNLSEVIAKITIQIDITIMKKATRNQQYQEPHYDSRNAQYQEEEVDYAYDSTGAMTFTKKEKSTELRGRSSETAKAHRG
eukprot:TRINITY_DN769_c0_g1_i1.p2 TRINITY_DN769_c0_g1~~TRINITY_DN769_c0_g1_i1.p2  ORF type:complete len:130 (+),score=29.97 TRINITY_DN769_c0_g1_i1:552-941(+)